MSSKHIDNGSWRESRWMFVYLYDYITWIQNYKCYTLTMCVRMRQTWQIVLYKLCLQSFIQCFHERSSEDFVLFRHNQTHTTMLQIHKYNLNIQMKYMNAFYNIVQLQKCVLMKYSKFVLDVCYTGVSFSIFCFFLFFFISQNMQNVLK